MSEIWTAEDEAALHRAEALRNALTEDIAKFGPAGDDLVRLRSARKVADDLLARKPKPPIFYDVDNTPGDSR